MKQIINGPQRSHSFNLEIAYYLSPGSMSTVYLIFMRTLKASLFYVVSYLLESPWVLLETYLHLYPCLNSFHSFFKYEIIKSIDQIFSIIIDILIRSLNFFHNELVLRRWTFHINSSSSKYMKVYIFIVGYFFSLLRFLRFYSYILLFLAAYYLF